jgi:AraC-like DNA-binding protein
MTTTRNPIATLSSLQVRAMVDALRELGVDADRVLARAGVARERVFDPEARISAEYDFALWDAATELSGDPAISLRVAERFALGQFGSFEYLLHNCSTFAQLIQHANAFMRLLDDLAQLELLVEDGRVILRLSRRGGYPIPPQGVECTFALLNAKARALVPAAHGMAREVHFTHPRVAPLESYEEYFGCRVRFSAEHNQLVGDASFVDQPLPGDPRLLSLLEEHARRKLEQVRQSDPLLHDVRRHLLNQLRGGASPDLALLARAMHMSERTLRRRLQAAGTRYQDMLDNLRAQLAKEYVLQAESDAVNVSERLGFSDPSTFYRAFKRWTGMTPAQYQKQMLGR